jgi:hypothetical protein
MAQMQIHECNEYTTCSIADTHHPLPLPSGIAPNKPGLFPGPKLCRSVEGPGPRREVTFTFPFTAAFAAGAAAGVATPLAPCRE